MARPVVELAGCSREYGDVRAVAGLDLVVYEGELLSLLGPSGCGKTTTLNLIAGFVLPTAGRVRIDGQDVTDRPAHQRGLGMVFQSYALFPHLSVFENVAFGLRERRTARAEIERRVRAALALVRLDTRAEHRPAHLSGGMQQRVALARALVYEPRVLLLDEPLAALDKKLREEMQSELREIQRAVGITTIFVTHDQAEALGLSGLRAGDAIDLAIRPERIRLAGGPGENVMDGRVTGVVYQGVQTELTVEIGAGQRLLVFVAEPAPTALAVGQALRLHLPPDAFMRLGPAGEEAGR